jgi:hypothetical protein
MTNVITALIDNWVPPEWVDHCYPYGMIMLNGLYTRAPINQGLFDTIDNEQLACLYIYSEPPTIAA